MPRPRLHVITPSRLVPMHPDPMIARRKVAAWGLGVVVALMALSLLLLGAL